MILMLAGFVYGKKLATLPQLAKPGFFTIEGEELVVNDGIDIYIYALTDFTLKKKFGKRGEGPGEFMVLPSINRGGVKMYVLPQHIVTNSFGKVMYFSREGKYIKELKSTTVPTDYCPMGDKYVGFGLTEFKGSQYFSTGIYGPDLKLQKELVKKKGFDAGKKMNPIVAMRFPQFIVKNNKIYAEGPDSIIHVFDQTGKPLYKITHQYKKVEVSDAHEKAYMEFYKTDYRYKDNFLMIKSIVEFPDFFPDIREFFVVGEKVYVLTYNGKPGNEEFLIFDEKGAFVKSITLPLKAANVHELYPFNFHNGNVYQLVENEDEEEWELHSFEVK